MTHVLRGTLNPAILLYMIVMTDSGADDDVILLTALVHHLCFTKLSISLSTYHTVDRGELCEPVFLTSDVTGLVCLILTSLLTSPKLLRYTYMITLLMP